MPPISRGRPWSGEVRRARLDAELVRRGLARSRDHAAELISNARVTVSGQVATKPATAVDPGAPLVVRADAADENWASRGAHKLVGALDAFPTVTVAGASLPGCRGLHRRLHRRAAAPRGAARSSRSTSVTGNSIWRLQSDERVHIDDRTNVRTLRPDDIGGPVDLLVADLSFISLHRGAAGAGRVHRTDRRSGADGQAAVRGGPRPAGRRRGGARPGAAGRRGTRRWPRRRPTSAAASPEWSRRRCPDRAGTSSTSCICDRTPHWMPTRRTGPAHGGDRRRRKDPSDRISSRAGSGSDTGHDRQAPRRVLLVAHTGRTDIVAIARHAEDTACRPTGSQLVALPGEGPELGLPVRPATDPRLELVLALGGDGTLLRAAEKARPATSRCSGVNLGRVGFLAEADAEDLDERARRGRRPPLRHPQPDDGRRRWSNTTASEVFRGWALNEISVEKSTRERILDVVVEVDGRGVSAYGCDGVLCATPTGSTAYAFSAGGPMLWPESRRCWWCRRTRTRCSPRPLVVGPDLEGHRAHRPRWAPRRAGLRRPADLRGTAGFSGPHAARGGPGRPWSTLADQPFTDRLVRKFSLPVHGWRDARH